MSGTIEAALSSACGRFQHLGTCGKQRVLPPVDYHVEFSTDRICANAQTVYLMDPGNLNIINCFKPGRHFIKGNRHMIAIESENRMFVSPVDDCHLEFSNGNVSICPAAEGNLQVSVGMQKKVRQTIDSRGDVESLFETISAISSRSVEQSPFRSHPFFREDPPGIRLVDEVFEETIQPAKSSITWHLPSDLRHLYSVAPLAYYLGAAVDSDGGNCIDINGQIFPLPDSPARFERWAGQLLSRIFQMECAIRYSASTGMGLIAIDVQELLGYSPEELMLMRMPERLSLYLGSQKSASRVFYPWHTASYVDPVPGSIQILPYLMRSLSAIYFPGSTPVAERDVISLSVRAFNEQRRKYSRGATGNAGDVVLPDLQNAQVHQWYSSGCPVDASLSCYEALKNGDNYGHATKAPEIVVICNEEAMMKEAEMIRDILDGIATVEVRSNLSRSDLLHTFSEGFDMLHFSGHCERSGLLCTDGFADLSLVEESNIPLFFLNCCASYPQGIRLIKNGSACGITTMFRVLDEAAHDISRNFYRLLAYGYPVITSYLGARECSVTGKEYLLVGDGSRSLYTMHGDIIPFYKLLRKGSRLMLQCNISSRARGLILGAEDCMAVPDTGFEISDLQSGPVAMPRSIDGMCLYGGSIYPDVGSALKLALTDFNKSMRVPGNQMYNRV